MMQEQPPTLHDTVVDVLRPLIADNGVSSGRIVDFVIGNGSTITEYAADLLVQAQNEVLLSTCFWAQSDSLATLHNALITLNNRARAGMRRVTVKILFSSFSFSQMFFSYKGLRKWGPKRWEKLGLPNASLLDSLDMMVVSRFQRPIGVMHGKFVVIDRKSLIVMSSNISRLPSTISLLTL
jgi:phosphatidylserine/phosphatidylglycerophosphate/cardiolipin synthase-like enzyme